MAVPLGNAGVDILSFMSSRWLMLLRDWQTGTCYVSDSPERERERERESVRACVRACVCEECVHPRPSVVVRN